MEKVIAEGNGVRVVLTDEQKARFESLGIDEHRQEDLARKAAQHIIAAHETPDTGSWQSLRDFIPSTRSEGRDLPTR